MRFYYIFFISIIYYRYKNFWRNKSIVYKRKILICFSIKIISSSSKIKIRNILNLSKFFLNLSPKISPILFKQSFDFKQLYFNLLLINKWKEISRWEIANFSIYKIIFEFSIFSDFEIFFSSRSIKKQIFNYNLGSTRNSNFFC